MPEARGGIERPMKPASSTTVRNVGQRLEHLHRHHADVGDRRALQPDRHRVEQAEQEAGAERVERFPFGEDEAASAMKPLPAVMSRTKPADCATAR